MRAALALLVVLLLPLQYMLWLGDFGFVRLAALDRSVATQLDANALLEERNQHLRAEVIDLKRGTAALEERARVQLGMIKPGEVFYQVIDAGLQGSIVQPISH